MALAIKPSLQLQFGVRSIALQSLVAMVNRIVIVCVQGDIDVIREAEPCGFSY